MCRRCVPTSKRNTEQRGSETPQEVLARFEEHLASYTTGEDWRRWLDAQAQFHNYSARNVMLILDQRPNASCVAGARKWEELGRAPVDGERAIHILAPATIKDPDHPESPD
jgi:hypothetical protein